jgi:serine protease Do
MLLAHIRMTDVTVGRVHSLGVLEEYMNGYTTQTRGFTSRTISWCLLMMMGSLATCDFASNRAVVAPVNAAATSDALLGQGVGGPTQPFIGVAKQVKAAVVNISAVKKGTAKREGERNNPLLDDPFFRRFFGEEFERRMPGPRNREQGLGSGVVVSPDGYIITNNHVVEQADELTVALPDKRTFKATVVGTDPKTDLAVIKIDATDLPTLPWGDSAQLQVGELVVAVGNPFGLTQTVTMGIISAVGRANVGIVDYEDFIQTDAAINPGNSGGALANLKGELIGINTAIFSQSGGYMGIGFAIPSSMAKNVFHSLVTHGKVVRGWIGVSIQEVTPDLAKEFGTSDTAGALVADVLEDGPAAKAKLERGDIIVAYNGTSVRDPAHLRALVADTGPGTTVQVSVLRDKARKDLSVKIEELPKDLAKTSGSDGHQSSKDHVLSGISVENVPNQSGFFGKHKGRSGVVVTDIERDSPAERAGLRVDDVIREINRTSVKDVKDFERLTARLTPRTPVLLLISRGNATVFLSIAP